MTVDKWSFTQEQRYFPCSNCNKPRYLFNNELTENCKPVKQVFCSDCYVPENPTRGWMLSKAKTMSKFDFDHYKTLGTDSQQETYLKKLLKVDSKVVDATENEYSKDDR